MTFFKFLQKRLNQYEEAGDQARAAKIKSYLQEFQQSTAFSKLEVA